MTTQDAVTYSITRLSPLYGQGEAEAITALLLEKLTGYRGAKLIKNERDLFSSGNQLLLESWLGRLENNEPVQYILEEAWFLDMKFYVDRSVLIPRPETEELVDWIIREHPFKASGQQLLDIGTGTGCIPIALKKKLRGLQAEGLDLSADAIKVAERNARELQQDVSFRQVDFLDRSSWTSLPVCDLICSNPPYIPVTDQQGMSPNVRDYEPASALFVPDDDPLLFYRAIAEFGITNLREDGRIYVEIYEGLGKKTLELFTSKGYNAELKKDMQGKDRMIRAVNGRSFHIRHHLGS
ncbi:MAG: peptide chain release factor N(5)-glutamine methyltransferase [Chitinophagaceae bacterium]